MRHELRDNGGCRQLRGGCGGQQGERSGGEGIEVFAVDHGVDAAAQFHQVFVGFQNQEGPVVRHGDAHGGVEGVARVAEGEHVAVEGRGGFVAGAHDAHHFELACVPFAVFENLQLIDAEGEELGGGWWFGLRKRWVPTARRRPARRSGPAWAPLR